MKDAILTIAAAGTVLAILLGAAATIGGIGNDLGAKTRDIAALQADNREIRGLIFRHMEDHGAHNATEDKK